MRPFFLKLSLLVASAVLVGSLPASAQYRRQREVDPKEIAAVPAIAPSVASLVLEHPADFALADSQRTALESIRRAQDSANRPWIQKLEGLRPASMPINPADLSPEQREEIAVARERTMALLTEPQQHRAAELEKSAGKDAEDGMRRRTQQAYRGERQGGQRGNGGRPPE
jgi:hypothetical protein